MVSIGDKEEYDEKKPRQFVLALRGEQKVVEALKSEHAEMLRNLRHSRFKTIFERWREKEMLKGLEKATDVFPWQLHSNIYRQTMRVTNDKTFFNTQGTGFFGVGPPILQRGDRIVILLGGNMPFALRPAEEGRYKLLREVYVLGIMHGELMARNPVIETFILE